jgi:hypothetical protein
MEYIKIIFFNFKDGMMFIVYKFWFFWFIIMPIILLYLFIKKLNNGDFKNENAK